MRRDVSRCAVAVNIIAGRVLARGTDYLGGLTVCKVTGDGSVHPASFIVRYVKMGGARPSVKTTGRKS